MNQTGTHDLANISQLSGTYQHASATQSGSFDTAYVTQASTAVNYTASVGRELGISAATTKVHTQTLYQRLGVHSSNAALHAAFANGATLGWYRLDAMDGEGKQH